MDEKTNQEYIALKPISTSSIGNNITFINGTFQFPTQAYTNKYADVEIIFTLTFQAIQDQLVNSDGDRIPNTIFKLYLFLWTSSNPLAREITKTYFPNHKRK